MQVQTSRIQHGTYEARIARNAARLCDVLDTCEWYVVLRCATCRIKIVCQRPVEERDEFREWTVEGGTWMYGEGMRGDGSVNMSSHHAHVHAQRALISRAAM